ncbi:hypothetical protein WX45_00750 [Clostridium ljungdahlii DSM 13528]|uniref:Uncharacterized protein n=2 Tax=Clostridium TaxID=1485 RepID=A0A168N049_9CLOT|nr:Hypothetical protein CLAU_2688 [Clostridium autoethanogenum DSM 10061]OAA84992.1 hypothetical protein WX45_00750 [Clostridium ljungdahlii DSM 13528]OAA85560.1 hypothetical protein WX73_03214 [Clostridium coskatii]OBR97419.1 hypothetical protein CLCOS_03990 [Clostridium coskatii]OVY50312.1 hypothetical protein WX72_03073 [Clostridium autoethanogenum]
MDSLLSYLLRNFTVIQVFRQINRKGIDIS